MARGLSYILQLDAVSNAPSSPGQTRVAGLAGPDGHSWHIDDHGHDASKVRYRRRTYQSTTNLGERPGIGATPPLAHQTWAGIHPTRQFSGVVSNDAFGAKTVVSAPALRGKPD
jgi:hypothetical protein